MSEHSAEILHFRKPIIKCSFCGREIKEGERRLEGVSGHIICFDPCVKHCNTVIDASKTGTYAAITFAGHDNQLLSDFVEQSKIPNPVETQEFHTTVIYSRNQLHPSDMIPFWAPLDTLVLKPVGFALFEDGKTLVMKVASADLMAFHQELRGRGASHDHDAYEPHITLSYDVGQGFDISALTLPEFVITAAELKYENLDLTK